MGAQRIGAALPVLTSSSIAEPDTVGPSSAALALRLEQLPDELDDEQFALVRELAESPPPPLPPAAEDYVVKCIRIMDASLPRQARDVNSGRLMVAMYKRFLSGRSEAELNFLSKTAIAELDWFPSVKQCLAILKRWHRRDEHTHRKLLAERLAGKELERRKELFFEAMAEGRLSQERINSLSETQLMEARRRGLLEWNAEERRFEVRGASSG